MTEITWTFSERTVKKHTVGEAAPLARELLKDKHKLERVCTDKLEDRRDDEKITTKELSDHVDDLVMDTLYWETGTIFGPPV